MQLIGSSVKHKIFGNGKITGFEDNIVTVNFLAGEKEFLYPDAFSRFLTLPDKTKQNEINLILNKQTTEENEKKKKTEKQREHIHKLYSMKILPDSQAAFNVCIGDESEFLANGHVHTGYYLSGVSKGKPRVPKRLKPNSACLLTACPKTGGETKRRILGAFMVSDDFWGEACKDGIVKAHKEYKILLEQDEQLLYWENIHNEEGIIPWGKVMFKYINIKTMQKILYDMLNKVSGTNREQTMKDFYNYYCSINGLPKLKDSKLN